MLEIPHHTCVYCRYCEESNLAVCAYQFSESEHLASVVRYHCTVLYNTVRRDGLPILTGSDGFARRAEHAVVRAVRTYGYVRYRTYSGKRKLIPLVSLVLYRQQKASLQQ